MNTENNARGELEKFFSKPFTDHQWGLISAQGYEDAIASGERKAKEVAEELVSLMEAAGRCSAGSEKGQDLEAVGESSLTWEEMEKLVLGRILATGETSGPTPRSTFPDDGERVRRLSAIRGRVRRRWWTMVAAGVGVIAFTVVMVLIFGGIQCGSDVDPAQASTTSDTGDMGAEGWMSSLMTDGMATSTPPATIPALQVPDYSADLDGSQVVPSVETEATGSLELTVSEDGETVWFVLSFQDLTGLALARLRMGEPGVEGDEIFTLYPGPTMEGSLNGVAAVGSFTADDLVGSLEGMTIADFIAAIEEDSVYVIVGSTEHRSGELRGQVE